MNGNLFPLSPWPRLALLATLLSGACTTSNDEPVPVRRAPQLVVSNPALIEQDTVVTGLGMPFFLQGSYYFLQVTGGGGVPSVLSATVAENGNNPRPMQASPASRATFSFSYQPTATRRALVTAEVRDGYTQSSTRTFWLRVLALPAPTVAFAATSLPSRPRGSRVTLRARLSSTVDLPAELRLYHYVTLPDGTFRLDLLTTASETALLAARQGVSSEVELPAFDIPSTEPVGDYNLLLLGRTRRRMQAQTFGRFFVN